MNQNYYNYDQIDFTDARIAYLTSKIEKAKDNLYYVQVPVDDGISMLEEQDSFSEHVNKLRDIYKAAQNDFQEFQDWKKNLGLFWYSKIKTRDALEAFIKEQKEKQFGKPLILTALDTWSKRVVKALNKLKKEKSKIAALEEELNELRKAKTK